MSIVKRRAAHRRWYAKNKERERQRSKAYHAADPKRRTERSRRLHGLPEPTRPEPQLCECCGEPPHRHGLSVDHDHVTGKFRGWLCRTCNLGIGALGDTLEDVERAADYLRRNT